MFVHVVLMRFPEADVARQAMERLKSLEAEVDVVQRLEVGLNTVASDQGYDLGLVVTLASEEDLERYESHPAHQEVATFVREHRSGAARCDFVPC